MTVITQQQVAAVDAGGTGLNATSLSVAYPSNNTANNLLTCEISAGQNASTQVDPTVTDTAGNTWQLAAKVYGSVGGATPGAEWIFFCPACASGANTVTVTFTQTQDFLSFNIREASGGGSLGWGLDQTNNATHASTVTATATQPFSFAVGVTSNWTAQPTSVAVGWLITENPTAIFTASAYTVLESASAYAPAFSPNETGADAQVAVANFFPLLSINLTLPGAGMTMSAGTFGLSGDPATAFETNAFQSLGFQILGGTSGGGGGNISLTLTGAGMTSGAGSFAKAISHPITGAGATAAAGSLAKAISHALTGAGATSAAGSFTKAVSRPITGAGATGIAGSFAKAVSHQFSGAGATALGGSFAKTIQGTLTGSNAVTGTGSFAGALTKPFTGAGVTASAGNFSVSTGSNKNVNLTGAAATAQAGSFATAVSKLLPGAAAIGSAGNLLDAVVIPLIGTGGVANAGNFAKAIAKIIPGVSASAQAGHITVTGPTPPPPPAGMFTVSGPDVSTYLVEFFLDVSYTDAPITKRTV